MRVGKLSSEDLSRIINENRGYRRNEVRVRSSIGEDCSVVEFGEYEGVFSTDPITAATINIGKLAVNINANDIASCGVQPLGILVTILAHPSSTLAELEDIMKEIDKECRKLKIEILGGHTEVTDAVNKTIISATVIGRTKIGTSVLTSNAIEGNDIIVTKDLCLEGTSIIANDFKDKAIKILNEEEIEEALSYSEKLSVVKEGKISGDFKVNAMHDITEGGILGALWELAEASKVGFFIYEDKMPITLITKKLCKFFEVDPLKFISSGSMLICTDNGEELVEKLVSNGIKATIIGKIINEKRVIINKGKEIKVIAPEEDEIYKLV
ncbi:AIR synthase family protein [Clostridium grantii]|uniref:Hydrogenase maturation protein, carbamoyl dehydratase HypE n=1 Tax=Clostridium grantii DSM 8605 TaxID=1121316 RepID=A0A1M5XE56_9CLOT|nr:AIR synthase family protein [Clostridium grantii]SHH98066.1 Hydrogenase maturation protein, carbamoyl dehydratase HypE [Clostridium grantii DSM 8605]